MLPDHQVTHFAGPVRLPGSAPLLLRVTAPRRREDELLDRLVMVSLHLPRRHRIAGLARRQRRLQGRPMPLPPKLAALGITGSVGLLPDKVLIDIGDINTALDAAAALIFHHAELLTTQAAPADDIINNVICYAAGINALAQSIYDQSQAHEKDPSKPNWVSSVPGTDWKTGQPQPDHPVYVWSGATLEFLRLPLGSALQMSKDERDLKNQCWTVQPGITQLPMTVAPTAVRRPEDDAEAAYTVKEVTPQSGVEHDFSYDPRAAAATISLKNYYLRWLQICVDQYGPGGEQVGRTQVLGQQSPVDTVMAVPLPPDWSDYHFTFDAKASRATVSLGGLGQGPFTRPAVSPPRHPLATKPSARMPARTEPTMNRDSASRK